MDSFSSYLFRKAYKKIHKLGDRLAKIEPLIDWEAFRPIIRDLYDTRRGLGDPDARLGRGKKGFLLGYQSLFLVNIEGFPWGHVEAPLNVNEKQLVEELLTRVLGECIEVELLAADSQFESQDIFELLDSMKIGHIIAGGG